MIARLNKAQSEELGEHLLRLAHDPDRNARDEIRVVYGTSACPWQLQLNGLFLHSDGEWATYAEGMPQPRTPDPAIHTKP